MKSEWDAIVIGGGLAGLTCATRLSEAGLTCQLLEASHAVGGRVRTDEVDGFLLDHGFQVFLTAYPEAREILDYEALQLCYFRPGALIRFNGRLHRLADPWLQPQHALSSLFSSAASLFDKLRLAKMMHDVKRSRLSEIYNRRQQTTLSLLSERGFSSTITERFFRPFLGGIFLDPELETSSRMCEFVLHMFGHGRAALPAMGMGQIPQQLLARLASDVVRTNARVQAIDGQRVLLASGERMAAKAIVIATTAPEARRLTHNVGPAQGRSVHCVYYAAPSAPIAEATLVLNGDGQGPINNLCVPSQISTKYAPSGQSLVSVAVLGNHPNLSQLEQQVRLQLLDWFGTDVQAWRHLKTYRIEYGLPVQSPPALDPVVKPVRVREGLFQCGDYCDTGSINGAMAAGRRAALSVIDALQGP